MTIMSISLSKIIRRQGLIIISPSFTSDSSVMNKCQDFYITIINHHYFKLLYHFFDFFEDLLPFWSAYYRFISEVFLLTYSTDYYSFFSAFCLYAAFFLSFYHCSLKSLRRKMKIQRLRISDCTFGKQKQPSFNSKA